MTLALLYVSYALQNTEIIVQTATPKSAISARLVTWLLTLNPAFHHVQ